MTRQILTTVQQKHTMVLTGAPGSSKPSDTKPIGPWCTKKSRRS
ncbi:hypothetical protein AYL99_04330 [Fonsecaea erecta]|uniref:Uncharacterized protein n=1 Tax=Fonsecaea erecta TaxID=1367422 RepID=A0A178ZQR5_9EURO|nr:hypothetical protein AYL99_04330 [Fonsecaea erecta]OAP62127.1 hypothetical protein AYL99_04330 [Fonsecaea erecta]